MTIRYKNHLRKPMIHPFPSFSEIAGIPEKTPALLHQLLDPLPVDVGAWRPEPDGWCIQDIIGHLIDTDKYAFYGRLQRLLLAPGGEIACGDNG